MKRLVIVSSAVALLGSMSFADPAPSSSATPESCQQIRAACTNAGFAMGPTTPKGKKLFKDCMQPIMDGKAVSGVAVDSSVIEACRAHGRKKK